MRMFKRELVLAASATAIALGAALPAAAQTATQTAAAADPESLTELVVTGSRIRGVEAVGSNVVGLDREVITQSTGKTVMEIVSNLPQLLNFGVNEQTLTSTSGTSNVTRSSSINLHGINQAATLVLFNGRRGPPMGTNGGFTDPSYIPVIAIENVQVIADGASAIYGADAIAGVVNFITRRNFDGGEVRGRVGFADGGYNTASVGAIAGGGWESSLGSGHLMVAFEHSRNSRLNGTERDFLRSDLTAEGGRDYRVSTCNPPNIVIGGVSYAVPAGGVTPATAASLVRGTRNLCETYRNLDFAVHQERNSATLYFTQDLGERVKVFAEGAWSRKTYNHNHTTSGSSTQVAALTVPSSNAFFVSPAGVTLPTCAASVGAPAGSRCETVEYDFRQDFGGLFHAGGRVRTWSATVGGSVDLGHEWQAELSATRGNDYDYYNAPVINQAGLLPALASSNPATAFNPFKPGSTPASVIANLTNGIFRPIGENELKLYDIQADGPLFSLPAGQVRMAVGAQHQEVSSYSATFRGTTAGVTGPEVNDSRKIKSVYGELFIPLVGEEMGVPGIHKLDLSLAGRIDDYSDVGRTENPKVGITWAVVEGFQFRASYGTSFRAPNLADLSSQRPGSGILFTTLPDPLSPTGSSTGFSVSRGNPDLSPETAKTYSAGFEVQPPSIPGLRVQATYWKINFTNQIQAFTAVNTTLSDPAFAFRITRNPSQALVDSLLNSGLVITGTRPPIISFILDSRPLNQGATHASGIDFDASYRWSTDDYGDFGVGVLGNRFLNFETKTNPTDPFIDRLDTLNNPVTWRLRASGTWSKGPYNAAVYANYTGDYRNTGVTPNEKVSDYTTFDIHLGYNLDEIGPKWLEGSTIALDVTNLFDKDPPFVNIQGGYDPVQASLIGRLVTLTLGYRW